MLLEERADFDTQMRLLFAAFNVPPSEERFEAYWIALNKLPLLTLTRTVEHCLGDKGPEKLPTANKVREYAMQLRSKARASAPVQAAAAQEKPFCPYMGFANRALLQHLRQHGPFAPAVLEEMIAAKNRIAEQHRLIATEETVTAEELRECLHKAFARAVHPQEAAA